MAAEGGSRGTGVQVGFGGQFGADTGDVLDREAGQRAVALGHQSQEAISLGAGASVGAPVAGLVACRLDCGALAAAWCNWTFVEDPVAEAGQGGGWGEGQAEQPEDGGAGGWQGGGLVR